MRLGSGGGGGRGGGEGASSEHIAGGEAQELLACGEAYDLERGGGGRGGGGEGQGILLQIKIKELEEQLAQGVANVLLMCC
jgi:hypothetical protein